MHDGAVEMLFAIEMKGFCTQTSVARIAAVGAAVPPRSRVISAVIRRNVRIVPVVMTLHAAERKLYIDSGKDLSVIARVFFAAATPLCCA